MWYHLGVRAKVAVEGQLHLVSCSHGYACASAMYPQKGKDLCVIGSADGELFSFELCSKEEAEMKNCNCFQKRYHCK